MNQLQAKQYNQQALKQAHHALHQTHAHWSHRWQTEQMKELLQTQNHTDYITHISEFRTEQ